MASQGEGKKRRSFLPAPRKATGLSPTSPQEPYSVDVSQQQPRAVPALIADNTSLINSGSSAFSSPSGATFSSSSGATFSSSSGATFSSSSGATFSSSSGATYPSSSGAREHQATVAPKKSPNADSSKVNNQVDELTFGVGLRVGAKVRIGGIKPGTLRYLGTTHLAPGIFCGIELLEADGKHDGEVNGHRYFVCARNHGIFAPKEKVCLDTTSSPSRLTSGPDPRYSSSESLNERTLKAFKSFEEGELEAIDCTKLSPILSPPDPRLTQKNSFAPQGGRPRQADKPNQPASCVAELRKSFESQDPDEAKSKKLSGLPKPTKSGQASAAAPHSKLPTFSRALKYSDSFSFSQRPSSNASDLFAPPVEAAASKIQNPATGPDFDQEFERSSPRHRTNSVRSSEDSEEDGYVRDTLSTVVKKQLRADSRQYLNFTFDEDELIQSLDQDDSEPDNNIHARNVPYVHVTNPIYREEPVAGDVSDGSLGDSLEDVTAIPVKTIEACPRENFMKIESATVVLKAEVQLINSPPEPSEGPGAIQSDSYTIAPAEVALSFDMNASSSEPEEDGAVLSLTRSISESEFPHDLLPRLDNVECFVTLDDTLDVGACATKIYEDGDDSLNRTIDIHKCESPTIPSDQNDSGVNQSQSYTVCSGDPEGKRDTSKRERDNSAVASHSYIISKSDSAASSPCRKYRKISTSSSANEGGDSSSSGTEPKTDSSGDNKGDNLDDSSTGASPEVSQALEWDYGQEFDGKIPLSQQDNAMTTSTSTGTSESLSDALRDISEQSDGLFEGDAPSSLMEDSDQFENPENEFENIDSIEDFPIFGKDSIAIMTDSGISDKDFDFCPNKSSSSTVCGNSSDECSREDDASSHTTTRAISSDSSQETLAAEYVDDTPGSVEDKDFLSDDMCTTICTGDSNDASRRDSLDDGNSNSPGSVVSVEEVRVLQDMTLVCEDLSGDNERNFSSHEDVSSSTDSSVVAREVEELSPSRRSPVEKNLTVQTDHDNSAYDSEGRALNRRERPVSLLSTTSADTGYVPDSDSELGTLTTNSPSVDWTDRFGVTHPTSHAPLDSHATDETQGCGVQIEDVMSGSNSPSTYPHDVMSGPNSPSTYPHDVMSGPNSPSTYPHDVMSGPNSPSTYPQDVMSGSSSPTLCTCEMLPCAAKTSDYDDNDLTANAEDDRIEADQVYGQWDQEANILQNVGLDETTSMDITREDHQLDSDHDQSKSSNKEEVQSSAQDEGFESREEKDPQSMSERKSTTKKSVALTKKRSENVVRKMPNTNVPSRLADYIRAPNPVKAKEDKEKDVKNVTKNAKNSIQKRMSVAEISSTKVKQNASRTSSVDRANNKRDSSADGVKAEKPEKPKLLVKRTPPKSKWGNIMTQIEASKDTVKPKTKSEVKSSVVVYLNNPVPSPVHVTNDDSNALAVNVVTEQPVVPFKREIKSNLKHLPPISRKIDLSKVKSKLNVPTAASAVKAMPKREHSPSTAKGRNVSAPRASLGGHHGRQGGTDSPKRMSQGNCVLVLQSVRGSVSSTKTSLTDISIFDSTASIAGSQTHEGVPSKRGSVDFKSDQRRPSAQSYRSDHSDKTRSRRDQTNKLNGTLSPFTPVKLPSRALEIRNSEASSAWSRRSSPSPVIIKPIRPRPKTNSKTVAPPLPVWGKSKASAAPNASPDKARNSVANNSKKPRANGTTKVGTSNARTTSSGSSINSINPISVAQAEIIRLESLCEARTKELTRSKIELRSACQAFDAMAALVNYCCVDLNAFECIPLANKLDVLQLQLKDRLSQIADLNSQKNLLETSLAEIILEKEELTRRVQEAGEAMEKEREEHSKVTHDMDDTHNAALTAQRDELTSKHDENIKKLTHFYDKQIDMLRLAHDRQVSDMKNEGKLEVNALKISHLEEIQELRNRHDSQMEELHKQHRNKLEDITHRFESIKLTLSEKVETLRGECDDLARRARSSEDALQRDADAKVQIALAPFLTLPKEIESLKMVLEMRNEEIQKLRGKNMEVEKQLEEIPISREKIISLQQKVENLEAIINIKTDHEKQLHEKCQILMRKYDRESRANKRLSMDYEQVVWRMSQSSEFGSSESLTKRHFSRSPPHSKEGSPDGRLRPMSPSGSHSDVVLRVKKRSSHSISEGDRQLRSRSATFVLEKCDSSSSHSPSLSPQLKQKRWRKKSQAEEVVAESEKVDRMCHSAGAEILSDLARQQLGQEVPNKTNLKDIAAPIQMSSDDMTYSYARSLSGVSDSGMYDSMTKSDVLDSSIVSTDSEWGTSINLSNNCDSTLEESGPVAGEFHLLNDITVIDAKILSSTDSRNIVFSNIKNGGSSSTRSSSSESRVEDDPQGNQSYVTLPQGPGVRDDIVFNESASKDSC